MKLPGIVMEEFRKMFQSADVKLTLLRERMEMILDGRRKRQLCEWWLTLIESEANDFLQQHGFVANSLPFNYLSVPPADLEVVKSNYLLIQKNDDM